MKKVTMADVAKLAGVSKSTVSQYINNRYEYMGDETRIKIKDAIERLGYQPNYIAKSLKQKRTSMIGIILADIIHRFSTEVSRSIEDFCYENDIHAIICNADNNPEKEKKYIEMLRAKQVDGLIIFPTGQNPALYKRMIAENYPVVFMDRDIKDLQAHFVLAENIKASYKAISHLIQHGHEHIAIVTQPLTVSTRQERIKGYKQALSDHQLPIAPEFIISAETTELKSKLHALFQLEQPPTALLAGNDLVFLEILSFLQENNLHIPEDVSLIVFDNIPFAHLSNPPVTIIAQPAFEMGAKAAELLLKQINKEEIAEEKIYFPCELIIRTTSIQTKKIVNKPTN